MGIKPHSVVIQPKAELASWPIWHIPVICWTEADMLEVDIYLHTFLILALGGDGYFHALATLLLRGAIQMFQEMTLLLQAYVFVN